MQTTYGYIYVAQVAMGADNAQTLKARINAQQTPEDEVLPVELLLRASTAAPAS